MREHIRDAVRWFIAFSASDWRVSIREQMVNVALWFSVLALLARTLVLANGWTLASLFLLHP